jgi:hypothetical protein
LRDDGIFLDSGNEGYVVQSSVWNNSDIQLFWTTIGRERLDCE